MKPGGQSSAGANKKLSPNLSEVLMIVAIMMGFILSAIMVMFMMTMYAAISGKLSNVESQIENLKIWNSNKLEDALERIDAFVVNHDLSDVTRRLDNLSSELVENSRDHVRLVEQLDDLASQEIVIDLESSDLDDVIERLVQRLEQVRKAESSKDVDTCFTLEPTETVSDFEELDFSGIEDLDDEILFEDEIETVKLEKGVYYANQVVKDEPIAINWAGAMGQPAHRPVIVDSILLKIYDEGDEPIIQVAFDHNGEANLIIQDPDGWFAVNAEETKFDHKTGLVKLVLSSGQFDLQKHRATIDYEFDSSWLA